MGFLGKKSSAWALLPVGTALFICLPFLMGQAPSWWTDREVLDPGKTPNDYAAVNQGQVKFMAVKAYEELNENLPGGAGTALSSLYNTLTNSTGGNYQPVNAGQLKNLAKPFYDRLIEVGYTDSYPWTGGTADDYAIVNIGQVKNLFKFDITKDTDSDSLPDWWEIKKLGNLAYDGGDDSDLDGLTNIQEFQQQSDPSNYYSQGANTVLPILSVVSGDNQTGGTGEFLAEPLVVKIVNLANDPLENAPVVLSVTSGGAWLAQAGAGAPALSKTLTLISDENGLVQAYVYAPAGQPGAQVVTATAASLSTVHFDAEIETVDDGPVGWWKLDETSGYAMVDSSGLDNDGELYGSPSRVEGAFGSAVQLAGSDQYLATPSSTSLRLDDGSFTLSAWFNCIQGASHQSAIFKKQDENAGFYLGINSNGRLEVEVFGGGYVDISTEDSFTDGNWHQVILVWDQELKQARILVDGIEQNLSLDSWDLSYSGSGQTVVDFSTQTIDVGNDEPLTSGKSHFGNTYQYFQGSLDDLRVYRAALGELERNLLWDSDQDGLPDAWEIQNFGDLSHTATENTDGDALTNLQEYQQGSNPLDPYNGVMRFLAKISGDGQKVEPEQWTPEPVVVRALDAEDHPLPNLAIKFETLSGEGSLSTVNSGAPAMHETLTVQTDSEGYAKAYFKSSEDEGVKTIVASTSFSENDQTFTVTSFEGASIPGGVGGGSSVSREEAIAAGVPEYAVAVLPSPEGEVWATATAVNASGEVVGHSFNKGAVVWRDGEMVDLNPNIDGDLAWTINDDGKIGVEISPYYDAGSEEYEDYDPQVLRLTTHIDLLYDPFDAACAVASANSSGTLVGRTLKKISFTQTVERAFVSDGESVTLLDNRGGVGWDIPNHDIYYSPSSAAYSISSDGRIVGVMEYLESSYKGHPESLGQVAAEFIGGVGVPLVPVSSSRAHPNNSSAVGINNQGLIIGYYNGRPCVWVNGKRKHLGEGSVSSINDDNLIVGYDPDFQPCIWFEKKPGVWVQTLVQNLLPPESEAVVYSANNNSGGTVAGSVFVNGEEYAALLVPGKFKLRNESNINEGWDPPIKGDVDPEGKKDELDWFPWTIVSKDNAKTVRQDFNRNELTKIVFSSAETAQRYELAVADADKPYIEINENNPGQPIPLTQKETPITIIGKNTDPSEITNATIEVRLKNDSSHTPLLKMYVKVVPDLKPLKLKFYAVTDSRFLEGQKDPGKTWAKNGTLIRSSLGVAGGMYSEIQSNFAQARLCFTFMGASPDPRDVPYLKTLPRNPNQNTDFPSYLENEDRTWVKDKFPEDDFQEGNINIILVHTIKTPVAEYIEQAKASFIGVDFWYETQSHVRPWDPSSGGPLYNVEENSTGEIKTRARTAAHETGHDLKLPNRRTPEENHDFGPYPPGTSSLMKGGKKDQNSNGMQGKWLRHEDWDIAVRNAQERLGN